MQAWDVCGEIKPHGAAAAGFAVAVGATQTLADTLRVTVMLLLVNAAVGNKLAALLAVPALQIRVLFDLVSETAEGVEIIEKQGHGGNGS